MEVALSERIAELNRAELHALRVIWRDLGLYGQLARAADRGAVVDLGDLSASGGEPVADFASAVGLSVAPCDQGSQQQRQPSRGGRVDHRARDERAPAASSYAVVNWRADAGDGRA